MRPKGRDAQPIGVKWILKEEKVRHQYQRGGADLKKVDLIKEFFEPR